MPYTYPTPIDSVYFPEEQRKAAIGSGLNNALIMAGLSMLGGQRTPYPQTFTENLARGLTQGFGAFNQTVAGTQQQAAENYWKKKQFDMQSELKKAHANLYDLMAKEKESEIKRQEGLSKTLEDIKSKIGNAFTDVSGNTYTSPEVENVLKMIMEGEPTNQDAVARNTTDFINTLKPYDSDKAIRDALLQYVNPETALTAMMKGENEPTSVREYKYAKNNPEYDKWRLEGKENKEVSGGNDMENFLGRTFKGFYTDKNIRKSAYDWLSTPEGNKAWMDEQRRLAGIRQMGAAPIYNTIPGYQTTEGQPVFYSGRSGEILTKGKLQKAPQESDIKFERDYKSSLALIDKLDEHFKKIEPQMSDSVIGRVFNTPVIAGKVVSQSDPLIASTKAITEATLSKLIRALGEVGTLTDADIQRARDAMPSIYDTIQVKNKKIAQLKGLLDEIYGRGKRYGTTVPNTTQQKSDTSTSGSLPQGMKRGW